MLGQCSVTLQLLLQGPRGPHRSQERGYALVQERWGYGNTADYTKTVSPMYPLICLQDYLMNAILSKQCTYSILENGEILFNRVG